MARNTMDWQPGPAGEGVWPFSERRLAWQRTQGCPRASVVEEKGVQTLSFKSPESEQRKKRDEEGAIDNGRREGAGRARALETSVAPGTT